MSPLTLEAGANSLDGSRDPLTGLVSLRLKCTAPDLMSAMYGAVPGEFYGLAEAQPRALSRDPAGDHAGYHVEIVLEGFGRSDGDPGEDEVQYVLDGSTAEDPIEAHPNLQTLLAVYGGEIDEDSGRAKWPLTLADGDSGQTRRNPMHGVDTYIREEMIWTRRMLRRRFPADLVRSLSTIETPPGNPPELSGNRVWIKIRARGTWRGNVWEIEESWRLSGPDGYVREMYTTS